MHVIENDNTLIAVDERNGAITRIFSKRLKLDLIAEPRLAGSFKLLLPIPERESNYISGAAQRLSDCEQTENGALLAWRRPLTNDRGRFDLDVQLRIELDGDAVEFSLVVENRTDALLAEVWCPVIGGIRGIGEREQTRAMISSSHWSVAPDLFQNFPNAGTTNWGIPYGESNWSYPGIMPLPWIDFYNPESNRGVYFGCHDEIARSTMLHLELWPEGEWPDAAADDVANGLTMQWVKFPHTRPGQSFQGPSIRLQFHDGDWHEGATIYRSWFDLHFSIDKSGNWLRREIAWYYNVLLNSEDQLNLTYADIPTMAADALRFGIRTIMISGWDMGGHDRGYPEYVPDPRVGSAGELRDAIAECHRLGVKVLLFVNHQALDRDSDWFREELHRYLAMDPNGNPLGHPMGWGQGTLTARAGGPGGGSGWTHYMMAAASPGFPEYRKIMTDMMVELARLGVDGLHIDKLCWNAGVPEFNPGHGRPPDLPNGEDLLAGVGEILAACRKVNPEFCVTGEVWWDRTIQFVDGCWWANPAVDHVSPFKFTFPEYLPLVGIGGTPSQADCNSLLLFGYGIFVGPRNYTRPLHEAVKQPSVRRRFDYLAEILRIGEELKETLFLGRFLDQLQVEVEADDGVEFRAHQSESGGRACVLVNTAGKIRQGTVAFEGNAEGPCRIYQPFEEIRQTPLPAAVRLPSNGVVVVLEVADG